MYEVQDGPRSAMIAVADFSAPQHSKVNIEDVIASGRRAIAQSFGGKVTADDRKAFAADSVRDVTFEIPGRRGQGPVYFQYVTHGRRLYTLGVLVDGGTVAAEDRDRFFGSFKILR